MENELLDDFAESEKQEMKLKIERKRLWYIIVTGVLLNAIILSLIRGSENWFSGFFHSLQGAASLTLILGFGLGLLAAFVPFRDLPYRQKYIRASQWSMVIVLGIMAIGMGCALWLAWLNNGIQFHF